jgi:hypothetical protein
MVVDMSFTKKVKTGNCKILIITYKFFVNLLSTLTNQPANQLFSGFREEELNVKS